MVVVAVPSLFGVTTSSTGLPDAPMPQNVPVKSQAAAGTSSMVGTVEDMHGAPIAGVVVTAAKGPRDTGQTATVDGAGKFTISGLEPGTYTVSITLPGRTPQIATEVTLGTREERETADCDVAKSTLEHDGAGECQHRPGSDGTGED